MPSADQSRWGVFDQLVGFADPQRLAAAAHPIVEKDPGRLAALARAGSVAKHETTPKAHRALSIFGGCFDHIEGLIHRP